MFRRPSREVRIGPLRIGADNPILIQSMTVADTLDTEAVAAEIEQLAAAGCPLVRVTVPHLPAADNLPAIREALRRRGVTVPLVADIHFKPAAALASIRWVEKVRINPGNYVDRKRFAVREYTDDDYAAELGRIREEFAPLVARLAETGTALRIGTNHGSLSDRIVNRYGDTPEGMVESALEFVRICESLDYRDIVLSMKSSVPSVMVAANRLLAARMAEEGMEYPIHLGVTEAGGGLEGRIKSAIGIGALLMEGIGDTIRVSLTEDSVHEIEACRRVLVAAEKHREPLHWAPAQRVSFPRRETRDGRIGALRFGGKTPCRVEGPVGADPETDPRGAAAEAVALLRPADPVSPRAVAELIRVQSPRSLSLGALEEFHEALREGFGPVRRGGRNGEDAGDGDDGGASGVPLLLEIDLRQPGEIHALEPLLPLLDGVGARLASGSPLDPDRIGLLARLARRRGKAIRFRIEEAEPSRAAESAAALARVALGEGLEPEAISFLLAGDRMAGAMREAARRLDADPATAGIPLWIEAPGDPIEAAVVAGSLLIDGLGDGLTIPGAAEHAIPGADGQLRSDPVRLAYTILQGCRLRLTRAEFIACPSCGRTLFDLQSTTRRIQERTAHLSGVKIAVMGCIVNGPGEMADADFGYVGSAPGKVDLYVGRTRVRQGIPAEEADQRLVDLIREHGMWVDPPGATR